MSLEDTDEDGFPEKVPPRFFKPPNSFEVKPKLMVETVQRRNNHHKNFIMAATGDPGTSKTYSCLYWAEQTDPKFDVEVQCVFLPGKTLGVNDGFWGAMEYLPTDDWRAIVWDDPTAGLSQRDWYMPLNRNVTKFIQTSSRYRKKNLSFPLPAYEVLDKAVRKVTGYEDILTGTPGLGKVHRVVVNRFGNPEVYKWFAFEYQARIPKCAKRYEEMRDTFTREYFTQQKMEDEKESREDLADRVYEIVKKNPKLYTDPEKGKITAREIVGDRTLHCSDSVARRVLGWLEWDEKHRDN